MGCMPAWPRCMTMRNWVGLGGRAAHPEGDGTKGDEGLQGHHLTKHRAIRADGDPWVHWASGPQRGWSCAPATVQGQSKLPSRPRDRVPSRAVLPSSHASIPSRLPIALGRANGTLPGC